MTGSPSILLLWFVAVLLVYTIEIIQIAVQNGRRFTIQHLLAFTTLIAAMLWLLVRV